MAVADAGNPAGGEQAYSDQSNYWIADVPSGDLIENVSHLVTGEGGSWGRGMNGYGDMQTVLNLNESSHSAVKHNDLFEPWARQLVRLDQGADGLERVYHAGIITDWGWNPRTGSVTLSGAEHEILFNKRFPFTIGRFPEGDILLPNTSDRAAMFYAIRKTFLSYPTPRSRLPLVMTYEVVDEPGPTSWDFPASEFHSLGDILDTISEAGGPDYDLRSHYFADENRIMIEPRIGAPYLFTNGSEIEVDAGAEDEDMSDWSPSLDGTDEYSGIFGTGEGYEGAIIRREAAEAPDRFGRGIYRDRVITRPMVKDQSTSDAGNLLNRIVYEARDADAYPTQRASFTAHVNSRPGLGNLYPGMIYRVRIPEDKMFQEQIRRYRVLDYQGNGSGRVKLTLDGIQQAGR